jgi:hypothetical protein
MGTNWPISRQHDLYATLYFPYMFPYPVANCGFRKIGGGSAPRFSVYDEQWDTGTYIYIKRTKRMEGLVHKTYGRSSAQNVWKV